MPQQHPHMATGGARYYYPPVRPLIGDIIEQLESRHAITRRVDLNDIGEVIGLQAVSYEEVEQIITSLEARGCNVGGPPSVREMALLREVLGAATTLRDQLGRKPRIEEIAKAVGHPAFVVRRAVETGGALGRPQLVSGPKGVAPNLIHPLGE